jgi:hypothetical protein
VSDRYRRLLGAVLERAPCDAVGPLRMGSTACTPVERAQACAWFRDTSVDPMSFRLLLPSDTVRPYVIARDEREPTSRPAEG